MYRVLYAYVVVCRATVIIPGVQYAGYQVRLRCWHMYDNVYTCGGGSCLSANPSVPYLTCDRAHRVLEGTHPRTLYTHMYMSYFTHVFEYCYSVALFFY